MALPLSGEDGLTICSEQIGIHIRRMGQRLWALVRHLCCLQAAPVPIPG